MFVAVIGHHTPCILLVFCYIKVAVAMGKRKKIRPTTKSNAGDQGEFHRGNYDQNE